jgi:hypothetical protein
MRRSIARFFCVALLAHCGGASAPSAANHGEATSRPHATAPAPVAPADATYDKLVQRAKAGDPTVNFAELRVAYVKSTSYRRNRGEDADRLSALRKAMFEAADKRDAAAIIPICNAILDKNFIDLDAHKFLKHAHDDLGHRDLAEHHRVIELGLLKSITAGKDGRSAATAWSVVTVDEEYFVLRMLEVKLIEQRLVPIGAHNYDVMETGNTETNARVTYYFNIDIHLQALASLLDPPQAR